MVEALQQYDDVSGGALATPDEFYLNAADTLAGLHLIPETEPASRMLRHVVGPCRQPQDIRDLADTLARIRSYLLVEANPDYWVEQVLAPESLLDDGIVEMTASIAQERRQQASLVSELMARLNSDFPLEP